MMLSTEILNKKFEQAQKALLVTNTRYAYNRNDFSMFPKSPGVYAIYRQNVLVYIGETAELWSRMKDLKNTYNHTFRKKLGKQLFPSAQIISNKYAAEIEQALNTIFQNEITVSFIEVNFGRTEIENYLIKSNPELANSISRRGN